MAQAKHPIFKRKAGRGMSWMPGRKGQGGEGLSEGYGGSDGAGEGASGPEKRPKKKGERASDEIADEAHRNRDYSPSLPSRDKIAKVLR
jgi:hypothetical protein